ncbi:GntR domain protein [Rhizobium sp. PDO1-076]|nr:GntR domain protein [Rhizobium sp. PDO1-076]
MFEARRKLEHVILELVLDHATADQLDALEKLTDEEEHIHHHGDEKSNSVLSGKFHVVLAELGGNTVLAEILSEIVARLSLVMSLHEEEQKDECGADHHRQIVSALKAKDLSKAQQLMDHHLADIVGRFRLTEGQGDRHTFRAVLENFSDQGS